MPAEDTTATSSGAAVRAAAGEGARLRLPERPADLGAVAELIRRVDHVLGRDPAHVAEVRAWTAGSGDGDGAPAFAVGRPPSPATLVVLRDFDSPVSPLPVEPLPMPAVPTTPGDRDGDQVAAGRALPRVLLTACAEELAFSLLSQLIEAPATRRALNEVATGVAGEEGRA
ncbi:hypothetical protein V5P93_003599 [Actinokineospora auranticolor]|uniref:Uncharacterized protein n=1 Tax=Actinokineospora auranticolor TaxID=155976 RepID=A0A2S6GJ30_9PSEU|nr:hypothetical protein [Actinokineospora auranticolor]PPK65161.1 hypothetical protein CLV40_1158 [Actinokineospora auranticolor]